MAASECALLLHIHQQHPRYSTVQYSAVQYSTVQYSTVHPRWRRPASLALKERSHYYEWGLADT